MTIMREKPKDILFFISALAFLGLQAGRPAVSPVGPLSPQWWDVSLNLKAEGDYKWEEDGPAITGQYALAVRWSGWLERDDHDYLLYRLDSRLSEWEAREASSRAECPAVLTTKDFRERPVFRLKYIIREGENLHLDFLMEPLAVPQSRAEDAFPLLLPSSEQNGQREMEVDYNACVIKGSNRVELPESEIYAGAVEKTFSWTWKHQKWIPLDRRTVFTSQSHKVALTLSIVPRFSRPKKPRP
jgi:hypothetical protein